MDQADLTEEQCQRLRDALAPRVRRVQRPTGGRHDPTLLADYLGRIDARRMGGRTAAPTVDEKRPLSSVGTSIGGAGR